jgi:hypothetical protein
MKKTWEFRHFPPKLWIRILDPAFQVNSDLDPIRIQGYDDQKLKKKKTDEKIFDQKLQFTDVQDTGEDISPQKKTSST